MGKKEEVEHYLKTTLERKNPYVNVRKLFSISLVSFFFADLIYLFYKLDNLVAIFSFFIGLGVVTFFGAVFLAVMIFDLEGV